MKRVVCLFLFLLLASVCADKLSAQSVADDAFVLVIDAGHGGAAFPGATYGGVMEKDINLAVALKLGALIEKELPQVKVVYTRKTDTALGKTLNDDLTARANIANKAGGDLFISIHANAATKNTVYGTETLIMGESSKETRYNESVLYNNNKEELIDMSDENTAAMVRAYIQNLQFTYGEYSEMMARIMQSHYAKGGRNSRKMRRQLLKVLYATDMPSVLTELGFMTNAQELAYLKSQKGQNELARMLCNAVKEYVGHIEKMSGKVEVNKPSEGSQTPAKEAATPQKPATTQKPADKKPATPQQPAKQQPEKQTPAKQQPAKQTPAKQPQTPAKEASAGANVASGYAIQVAASSRKIDLRDPQFKSYRGKVRILEGAGALKYKYCYGEFATQAEAQRHLAELRKSFPGAFVVAYKGNSLVKK
ncbi:MAG: N-acetylmuramoyl-L-alanine amidase [Rikenellaceae bacterium]|nr:N-acetylmuramoyl-L-alanine amidase [Rikenellaceae bacterium]